MINEIQIIDLNDNSLGSYYDYSSKKKISSSLVAKAISYISTCVLVALVLAFYQNVKTSALVEKETENSIAFVQSLYSDSSLETPKENITIKDINKAQSGILKIKNDNVRSYYSSLIQDLYKFDAIKTKLYECFDGENILSSISSKKISEMQTLMATLSAKEKGILSVKYNLLLKEYTDLSDVRSSIRNLFTDDSLTNVRENVTLQEFELVKEKASVLPQTDELEKNKQYLDTVENYINSRELQKKQAEAYNLAVQQANFEISSIPYISQTANKVYNGCEAASLLMALKYKGIALNYDLATFASIMPKHETDPHQGFVNSIFDVAPLNVVHWIAPDALAAFGSKFANTKNVSGIDTNEIKKYVDSGLPVVVYGTYNFDSIKSWSGEVPSNLHVVLVIGYNKITGDYIINDPWSGKKTIAKDKFESVYNAFKYAVVVE